MEDHELLREYADQQSDPAFAELVRRHVDMVYSIALRLVHQNQLAEDVTQLVFIRLAQKARSIRPGVVLTGWLYRTTQFAAQAALRSDWRRRKRESLAMQFSDLNQCPESSWDEVAPLLEEAMGRLRPAEQDAVLLRFFGGKSLQEVGHALGISDDGAQKRISRALGRLRQFLARRGVNVPMGVLGAMLAANTTQAAPTQFASALAASVGSAAGKSLGFAMGVQFLKAAFLVKIKACGAGAAVSALLILGTVIAFFQMNAEPPPGPATNDLSTAAFVLRGRVLTPDGKPLGGALVRAAAPGAMVRLYYVTNAVPTNARVSRVWTTSAANGTFAIGLPSAPMRGQAVAVVNSDAGYALATADELSANPDVIVKPWGRLEGVLRVGKSLGTNQMVNIGIWGSSDTYEWTIVGHGMSVQTDAEGRFVFPRVAPGDVWLTRSVAVRPGEGRESGHHYVRVGPGENLQVTLGGTGCLLTGRVDTAEVPTNLVFYGSMWARESQPMRTPRNWRSLPAEERRRMVREWRDSPDSEPFKQSVRNYEFPVRRDGSFTVEDVLPGSYRMQIRADRPVVPGERPRSAGLAAKVEMQVEVQETSEANETLDLGVLVPIPTGQ
ncbi:MAG TPA: sigma-70 family RNA polymerase sigma factor [Verrucomicrobiae bacterium]|nr:sigma-70 family RNA polymerase sigma factor [Verrucomicrobiae bacterium]